MTIIIFTVVLVAFNGVFAGLNIAQLIYGIPDLPSAALGPLARTVLHLLIVSAWTVALTLSSKRAPTEN